MTGQSCRFSVRRVSETTDGLSEVGFDRSVGVCQLKKRKDALDGGKGINISSIENNAVARPYLAGWRPWIQFPALQN